MFISVEAVRWVLTQSKSERSARLVLLAIAAHCNEDGRCWPGMDALLRYTKLSKNTILQARDELVSINELVVETGGKGAGDTNHYYLSAFMDSRVQKGSENPNKGSDGREKGFTRVHPNNKEEEVLEQAPSAHWQLVKWAINESMKTGEEADTIMREVREGKRRME